MIAFRVYEPSLGLFVLLCASNCEVRFDVFELYEELSVCVPEYSRMLLYRTLLKEVILYIVTARQKRDCQFVETLTDVLCWKLHFIVQPVHGTIEE